MSSIAERPQGCRTCKRRRQGCDRSKPQCQRCMKAGLQCLGYDDSARIVVYHHPNGSRPLPSRTESIGPDIRLPHSLQSSALKSSHFEAGWCILRPATASPNHPGSLLLRVRDFPAVFDRETALHSAFGAVTLARLGQRTRDASLIAQGYAAYAKALARFQARLKGPRSSLDDETLACMILFSLFEITHAPGVDHLEAVRVHLQAAQGLVKRRGPLAYAESRSCGILKDMFRTAVWESLGTRQRTFLGTSPWTRQMWRQSSEIHGVDELFLKMASFPETFEKLDRFKRFPVSMRTFEDFRMLYSSYDRLLSEISNIRQKAIASDAFHYRTSVFLDSEKHRKLLEMFPRVRVYHDSSSAGVDIVFASAQLALHLDLLLISIVAAETPSAERIRDLHRRGKTKDQATFTKCALDAKQALSAVRYACDTVIETFEHFLRPDAGMLAAGATANSVGTAVGFFAAQGDPKLNYILTVVALYQAQGGFPFADLLHDAVGVRCPAEYL